MPEKKETDPQRNNYIIAIVILGIMSIAAIGGVIVLTTMGLEPPAVLDHLIFTAAGALGGLLAPRGNNNGEEKVLPRELNREELQILGDHRTKNLIADAMRDMIDQSKQNGESDNA